ncbi:GGDEF domain-containing response regulator [Mariluticola halotolerans]|uniref:GGDEF domain-containing response regulator n=1 Tax=Mariluticola halotolerans TaxID=2909283 RepID=UPI0026E26718|nr:response regulator [Mariluticola halotolerans]UJQ93992.1 response regulator [Mariluticola halotolerans]
MDGKRIAVVDDDPLFLEHVTAILAQHGGMRAVPLENDEELFRALDSQDLSCIVLDYDMGNQTGLALGQAIKQKYADAPPIVMLTGQGSERTATKAFRIGFSDYISKRNLDPKELILAIRGAIAQREAEQARQRETERLRRHQRQDSLTGLYSSSYVRARLDEIAASQSGNGFTLFTIRVRNLTELRMRVGHAASERVFRDFASRLGDVRLDDGFIGHLGSYDLACVFERVMAPEAIADVQQRLMEKSRFTADYEGSRIDVSVAIGSACFPEDGDDPQEVINAAMEGMKPDAMPGNPEEDRRQDDLPPLSGDDLREQKRRAEQRFRVLKKGKIIINGLNTVLDCSVRNISESGAYIRVDGYFAAPTRFQLQISGDDPRWVSTRWQVGGDIGVEYQEGAQ